MIGCFKIYFLKILVEFKFIVMSQFFRKEN